jgi:DhnA family fructose-bisphosphate aldolase class Ia
VSRLPWGKENRLARLRTERGSYFLLALDHGLSAPISGLEDLGRWIAAAARYRVSGVVVHKGMVPRLPLFGRTSLVLQTFGLPDAQNSRMPRVPVASVEDALRLSADAIAIQLSLEGADPRRVIEQVAAMVSAAGAVDLPVLFMVTVDDPEGLDADRLAFAIRACTELGADLIKVPLPRRGLAPDRLAALKQTILGAAPVLVAGGPISIDLEAQLAVAASLGFRGACIGRHVFQAERPEAVLALLEERFAP